MFATAIWKYQLRYFRLLIYEDIKSSKLISMFSSTYISIEREKERESLVVCVTQKSEIRRKIYIALKKCA